MNQRLSRFVMLVCDGSVNPDGHATSVTMLLQGTLRFQVSSQEGVSGQGAPFDPTGF